MLIYRFVFKMCEFLHYLVSRKAWITDGVFDMKAEGVQYYKDMLSLFLCMSE